ncbi:flagellar protein FlgN [Hippea maritima]|uniref:FlgN family protein n=1 Tax=Hippea maritima (strain ATCC 700847 / DSM 10411 / MH2) TaxID=760142 RepID=F2LY23_HIPMA|nr:flagellar protein FlgN [Hippea maritima]AEA33288.1 FlgN family protein [Hippea maritima DSM 10411]
MNNINYLKDILNKFIDFYDELLKIVQEERKCLVNIDADGLEDITSKKQVFFNEIAKTQKKLKEFLDKFGFETINEFLFFASRDIDVDDLRVLNGKLQEKLKEFKIKSEINRMIATEHLSFFGSLLNLYGGLLSGENYNKQAQKNINTQLMNLRV